MEFLLKYLQERVSLTKDDINLIRAHFVLENFPSNTYLLKEGKIERHIYFLVDGIVRGYQNIDGKIVVQHLITDNNVFTSLDSFISELPSLDYLETITDCKILKISKANFDILHTKTDFFKILVKDITADHLKCKLERVKDFQTLTAKASYLKFISDSPKLASQVSVENIASFLGIEPQSLSRIRKQIAF